MPIAGFQPTSRFLAQLKQGAVTNVFEQIDVYDNNGNPIEGYTGLPIEAMTVTAQRQNTTRTTVSLTVLIDDKTYWPVPTDLSSPVSPNGNELYITTGFLYSDGSSDSFQQGKFPIVTTSVAAQGSLLMNVSADDRSWSIGRRGLLAPFTVYEDDFGNPLGTISDTIYNPDPTGEEPAGLLNQNQSALPQITYSIAGTDQLAAANTYSVGQDPWQASTDLANSTGWELYLDWSGNVAAAPPPVSGNPVWDFAVDPASLLANTATRTLTADDVFNDFFVITANSDSYDYFATNPMIMPPVQAELVDNNAGSPTYYKGKFGDCPQFIQSSVSTNYQAAVAEATLDLQVSLGQIDMITLVGPLNPAVLIDDFCTVTIPRLGLSSPTLYVVDGFTSVYQMNGTTTYTLRRVINGQVTTVSVAPPNAPSGLTAVASGTAGDIDLSWTAPLSLDTITTYDVWSATESGGEQELAVTGSSATTYTATGLDSGTTYYFTVAAVSGGGEGPQSNEASAVAP